MAKKKHGLSTEGMVKGQRYKTNNQIALTGNDWWNLRSKHGRDKLFASPQLLWEAACEYFAYIESNPLEEEQLMSYQGETTREKVNKKRPFTMKGLCLYLGCASSYFRVFKATQKDDNHGFLTIIEQIEDVIYNQKFEGAASGLFNGTIISRDLGLIDKTESKTETLNVNITPSAKEAKEIRKALEKNI